MAASEQAVTPLSDRVLGVAIGDGNTYSLLWIAGIAVLVSVAAFWIRFSARDIAQAEHTCAAAEAGEL